MSAIQQLITEHMDIWTAADTGKRSGRGRASGNAGSVYGVKKLRELILELAVRGKLVPQDANDEPASELLKRIQTEKALLSNHGRVKKDMPPTRITESEKSFALPRGWEWVRFGDALISRDAERIPVSSDERQFKKGQYDYYGASGVIDKVDKYIFDKPLLLIGEDGANLINRSTPIAFIARGKYWVNNHAHVLDGISEDFLRYIELYINAIDLKPYVTGTAQPKMNQSKMNSIVLGLPSEGEQNRIVAKVDELMALCDQLEAQHSNAAEAHEKLVSHLLGTLTQSQSADDFSANWQRIAAHFDTLFTTETSIDALKQTLLQLAVMGKLVQQDANDESASELLKRIQAEKTKLVAEGKIKKEKPLSPIADDEKPFELPQGWEWVHLPDISDYKVGKTPSTKSNAYWTNSGDGYNWVSIADLNHDNYVFETNKQITSKAVSEVFRCEPAPAGTILMSFKLTLGKISLLDAPAFHNEAIISIYPNRAAFKEYLFKVLPARAMDGDSKSAIKGNTLNSESIAALLIPLPPLAEQHRIVAKVDELMALCDQLKSRVTSANQQQQKLADVLVEQAVA